MRLIRASFPDRPSFGTAVSEAILVRVAAGELPPTLRLHRPGRELAFSKQDAFSPGFSDAVCAARDAGFAPVLRLAGGRAAAFHEGTLALTRATAERWPTRTTRQRFEETSGLIATALGRLGIDARVGEVPGEYCPGPWSVNARGCTKLVGVGQRIISGGAHVGSVIVATGRAPLRAVLEPVYEALDLEWDPATVGSVQDEVGGAGLDETEETMREELAARYDLVEAELDSGTLALAERLEAQHAI